METISPFLSAIAAASLNGAIGVEGKLPWHIPEDLKYFRRVTAGKTVVMGRKTIESIGRVLPGRRNIVLSRDTNFRFYGAESFTNFKSLVSMLSKIQDEVFIIGGGEIYSLFLPYTKKIYLTIVDLEIKGDAFFPEWDAIRSGNVLQDSVNKWTRFVEMKREECQQHLPSFRF